MYTRGSFTPGYASRCAREIDRTTELPIFRIENVTADDAGLYKCHEIININIKKEARHQITSLNVLRESQRIHDDYEIRVIGFYSM